MTMICDPFDSLPDPLLLCILNKLCDIKALGRCSAVSKRFNSLVIQVEDVVVKVDCVISAEESNLSLRGKSLLSHIFRVFMGSIIIKPLHALQQLLVPKKSIILPEVSHHSPGEVLKNFKRIKNLRIELPGGESGIDNGVILKWRAEFGSTLESCVILAASSLINTKKEDKTSDQITNIDDLTNTDENDNSMQDTSGNIPQSFFINGGLKLRVVWTISSLIAASARHFLLQQIVLEHPTLEGLTLVDAEGQGTLCMNKQQLLDFRERPIAASASSNRTQIPALNIKLWYAPCLHLPGGVMMKGATLVAIRPSGQSTKKEKDVENFAINAFESPYDDAIAALIKRRTYLLEMNSF